MDTARNFIVPLTKAYDFPSSLLGNKSRNLSLCIRNGYRVPDGFALSIECYRRFAGDNNLQYSIDFELYRKPFENMRWEEIWDAAFRIRSIFTRGKLDPTLENDILKYISNWPADAKFAVRSSAPAEDSAAHSFAGIHESYVNVPVPELIEKIKLVWASLWSDRSLLYRLENKLDARKSAMAVLIQLMEPAPLTGLAFTADPATGNRDQMIVESVEGSLDRLVDNIEEPQRFVYNKKSDTISELHKNSNRKIITTDLLDNLALSFLDLEKIFEAPIDIEWAWTGKELSVLQVRPITKIKKATVEDSERDWYLTLTPKKAELLKLAERVEKELIPGLIAEVEAFAAEGPPPPGMALFLDRLKQRGKGYEKWKKTYRDDFIPFAHGIRSFGLYYNELLKPDDPYIFINLLKSDQLLAAKRNNALVKLGENIAGNPSLKEILNSYLEGEDKIDIVTFLEEIARGNQAVQEFTGAFRKLLEKDMNIYYENRSLAENQEVILKTVVSLSNSSNESRGTPVEDHNPAQDVEEPKVKDKSSLDLDKLEKEYFEAAGRDKREEAVNWLRIGRLSWKLRDDDNILLGKLENQLLEYMKEGLKKLKTKGLVDSVPGKVVLDDWETVLESLKNNSKPLLTTLENERKEKEKTNLKPRQLIGQPSSPGIVTARARVINSLDDFKNIERGEILVFDAVQPQMTFIISLAGGIIERRGGMLVHSSIIAREMEIPAVNGVNRATELIDTGDLITLNGDLGIVVIGEPEFNLEKTT